MTQNDEIVEVKHCSWCDDRFPMKYKCEQGGLTSIYEVIGNRHRGVWLCNPCLNVERDRVQRERRLIVVELL